MGHGGSHRRTPREWSADPRARGLVSTVPRLLLVLPDSEATARRPDGCHHDIPAGRMTLVGQIALSEICLHISDRPAERYPGIRRRISHYDDFLSRCRDQPVANCVLTPSQLISNLS